MVVMSLIKNFYSYMKIQKSIDSPLNMILFVTTKCNSRCKHCFFWKNLNNDEELTLGEIEKLSASLKKPLSTLILSGGEPFLREDIAKICKAFSENNKTERIVIPTNGFLTDRICENVEKILNNSNSKIAIQVSLDGLEKTHDYIRGVKDMFRNACRTIIKLKELQKKYKNFYSLSVMTVVSRRNFDEIEKLNDYVRDELGCFQNFELVRGTNYLKGGEGKIFNDFNPKDAVCQPVESSKLDELNKKLEGIYRKEKEINSLRDSISLQMSIERMRTYIKISKTGKSPVKCLAGKLVGVIYANGDVSLCELTNPVGNLRKEDFDFYKIWNSKDADFMRKKIKNCSCTHSCFIGPSIYCSPKMFAKSVLKGTAEHLGANL
ncbi:MAG: radical SAM protein [Candidatus Aenigmatarchaeota archaeon]